MSKRIKLQVVKTDADYDSNAVVGRELFPELYANIYICGKKKSGKTQLVYNILRRCANKSTKVIIFSATVNKDPTYKEILKMLDTKGIDHMEYEHFINDEKTDLLQEFIARAKETAEEEFKPAPANTRKYVAREDAICIFGDELPRAQIAKIQEAEEKKTAEKKATKKAKGKLSPEYILVFDDLGEDMRKKSLSQLLIKNRHFKCKTICLSQWISYLPPCGIRQLDYVILFPGFNSEKIEDLHTKLDLSDTVEEFTAKYNKATEKQYHFMLIDISGNIYRQDFNELL